MIERFRERAAGVKRRNLPPVAGEERRHFLEQAQLDFQDFAMIGDAEAAFDHLAGRAEYAGRPIVIFGRSLGAAVAVRLATVRGAEALVIHSPFTSVADMARTMYRFLPVSVLVRARFDNLATVPSVRSPVLVLHGTDDEIVPIEMGRRVHGAVTAPSHMVELEGATHNEPHHDPGEPYFDALREFLEEVGGRP